MKSIEGAPFGAITIVYDPIACSNRLLFVAQALTETFTIPIDVGLLARQITQIEGRLSRLSYPYTCDDLPILTGCLAGLQAINNTLYGIETSEKAQYSPTIYIDYVCHALESEIDRLPKH